jgi:D-alanyl-D-alanine carboxypeptidase/D-alanyl-D-alanine-endopeptidase (penicillin-binding protein 4)
MPERAAQRLSPRLPEHDPPGRSRVRRAGLGIALALLTLAGPISASSADPGQALARKIMPQMASAGGSSGAWVVDATSGKELFLLRPNQPRTPASVEKLLTSSTVLARFGEDARLETTVSADSAPIEDGILGGSVYIKGFGDPSFATPGLARLANQLLDTGLDRVTGRIYGDESYFDSYRGLPWGGFRLSTDIGPLSALSFNEGTLRGFGRGFQSDPARFVAQRLRAHLRTRGVRSKTAAAAGKAPSTALGLASVRSPRVADLIRHMNRVSDNYFAETLLKGLGARFGGSGSTAAGARVVTRFLATLGVPARVFDGSGLSRGDAISPAAVGHLLLEAQDQPWFDSFHDSLAIAGRSGTLRRRMRHTAAAGRCRAKTGTLIGVSALAGYCRSRQNHRIAFALLMNGVNVWRARRSQDRIAAALARYSP